MRYESFIAVVLFLVPLSGQAGSLDIGTDTTPADLGSTGLNLVVDSPLDMGDANPGDGLCATAMATCTLRAAIEESYAYEGPADTITLPAGTYVISSSLNVWDGLSLLGEDRDTTIIDADGADVALYIAASFYDENVIIDSVTVRGSSQAGIDVAYGSLSLISSRVRDNSKYGVRCSGYGIPELSILDSEVLENGSDGVFVSDCEAWIVGSSISHNKGCGVVALEGTYFAGVTLEDSYVGENLKGGLEGYGIAWFKLRSTTVADGYSSDGCAGLDAVNSTFSGAGISIPETLCGPYSLTSSTITGGINFPENAEYEFSVTSTILAGSCGPEPLVSGGFNLIVDTTRCSIVGDTSTNITDVDPELGPLADNGGPTPTHRPLVGSPAIDAIPLGDCTVSTDQRGVSRPQGPGCDIGSVEADLAVSFDSELYLVEEGVGVAEIGVLLVGSAGPEGVLVSYRTMAANSSATEGEDYVAVDDTLVWGEGESGIQNFFVPIIDDDVDESDKPPGNAPSEVEYFRVELYDPVNAGFDDGVTPEATVVIVDNDGPPEITFSDSTYTEDEAAGFATIQVLPNKAVDDPNRTFEVSYSATAGTATAGADFTPVSGTFTWGVGDMNPQEFQVPIVQDGIHEDTETIILQLSNPVYGTLGSPSKATLEIVDDDPLGEVSLVSESYLVDETAGTAEIEVQLVGSTRPNGASVLYEASAGTAVDGKDFKRVTGSLAWPPGIDGVQTFSVPILDDKIVDGDKTVVLTLSDPTGIQLAEPYSGELVLADDETLGKVSFTTDEIGVDEGVGDVLVQVQLIGHTPGYGSVIYEAVAPKDPEGAATAGEDFTAVSGMLEWENGNSIQTFEVPILEDRVFEETERVRLVLRDAVGIGLTDPMEAALFIRDNDTPPTLNSIFADSFESGDTSAWSNTTP